MSKNGFPKIVLRKNFKKMSLHENGLVYKNNNFRVVTETFFYSIWKRIKDFLCK
jgi:hypothetical protein